MAREQVFPAFGERVAVIGNYSEASMHLRVAGEPIEIALVECWQGNGDPAPWAMAQIYRDGKPYSFPVLPGEAGFYRDGDRYYTYRA